jgi:hypothetical protein
MEFNNKLIVTDSLDSVVKLNNDNYQNLNNQNDFPASLERPFTNSLAF